MCCGTEDVILEVTRPWRVAQEQLSTARSKQAKQQGRKPVAPCEVGSVEVAGLFSYEGYTSNPTLRAFESPSLQPLSTNNQAAKVTCGGEVTSKS